MTVTEESERLTKRTAAKRGMTMRTRKMSLRQDERRKQEDRQQIPADYCRYCCRFLPRRQAGS